MNIYVAVKVVPDDADIAVAADRTLDYSKARPTVSTYDLNAIEAGAQLAAQLAAFLQQRHPVALLGCGDGRLAPGHAPRQ